MEAIEFHWICYNPQSNGKDPIFLGPQNPWPLISGSKLNEDLKFCKQHLDMNDCKSMTQKTCHLHDPMREKLGGRERDSNRSETFGKLE